MEYGLQLYSVRDFNEDFDYCFSRLNEFKYKFVEFASTAGKTADELKALLEKWDMTVIGAHVSADDIVADFDGVVKFHKALGNTNIVIPAYHIRHNEGLYRLVEIINEYQPKFEAEGMKLHYHNHEDEFKPNKDGTVPFEVLKNETNVLFEVDTFWVFYAGLDPVAFVKENIDRIELLHIKDGLTDRREGRPLGEGKAPVKDCVNMALELDLPIIVESEGLVPNGIMEAKKCYKFLRKMDEEKSEAQNG
ncbi:MAG: sugar phosphate isomerase/epimerase [Clostridia bacterium]|nr:sugar phosphate isomerase/epimerase [Clostridia bacterium]